MFNYVIKAKSIFMFNSKGYLFLHRSNFDSLDNYQKLLNEIYRRMNNVSYILEVTKIVS